MEVSELSQGLSQLSLSSAKTGVNLSKSDERRVGLVYDSRMMAHEDPSGEYHPERPTRISKIFETLQSKSLSERCVSVSAREASADELQSVHGEMHVEFIKSLESKYDNEQLMNLASSHDSIYFSKGSSKSALLAAGSLTEISKLVAKDELDAGAAIIRPPGHHAEKNEAKGFCLFNNVAVAAKFLLQNQLSLGITKILIVDWDVHHGNGTQNTFWDTDSVLYFSVHRYEDGYFYPGGVSGASDKCGSGSGIGYNANVAWPGPGFGDADYLAVWDHFLIPMAEKYNPDIVLISAGFDSALGDPLGHCRVTPFGYSQMTHKLCQLAKGKVVLALEGGYNLDSISSSYSACVSALLGDAPLCTWPENEPKKPSSEAVHAINLARKCLAPYWPVLEGPISQDSNLNVLSVSKLSNPVPSQTVPEREQTMVWYASYGSNMSEDRFLCYIRGGSIEGMKSSCKGCTDNSLPQDSRWIQVRHRMFFGQSFSGTWGQGGVCFLNPNKSEGDSCNIKLYKITLNQFNDVVAQENKGRKGSSITLNPETLKQLFKRNDISGNSLPSFALIPGSWYGNIIYLGEIDGFPVLSFTCSQEDIIKFYDGQLPVSPPSESYKAVIVGALVQSLKLSQAEAEKYISDCSRPLA